MSESNVSRPVRRVAVTEHLWETFEQMALEMGTERDGLINQAMFMFARLNGFLNVGQPEVIATSAKAESRPVEPAPDVVMADAEPDPIAEAENQAEPDFEAAEPAAYDDAPAYDEAESFDDAPAFEEPAGFEDDPPAFEDASAFEEEPAFDDRTPLPAPSPAPAPRRSAAAASAGLPRLSRGGAAPVAAADVPVVRPRQEADVDSRRRMTELASPSQEAFASSSMDNDPARKAVAERVLETAAELERLIKGKQNAADSLPPPTDSTGVTSAPLSEGGRSLYMMGEDGELEKIAKDRFLIGRGKHCDLIINSGKVSREHAVITHEDDDFFIEDLGSSNGTWFNKQRIKRRKIDDGDEYFICSDRVKCVIR